MGFYHSSCTHCIHTAFLLLVLFCKQTEFLHLAGHWRTLKFQNSMIQLCYITKSQHSFPKLNYVFSVYEINQSNLNLMRLDETWGDHDEALVRVIIITPVQTYFSCGDCFWAPGPEEAGIGPGWKAWLGEVVAERARWGEPWADWDGEAEAERCPPAIIGTCNSHVASLIHSSRTLLQPVTRCSNQKPTNSDTYLVWAVWSVEEGAQSHYWVMHMYKYSAHMDRHQKYSCSREVSGSTNKIPSPQVLPPKTQLKFLDPSKM